MDSNNPTLSKNTFAQFRDVADAGTMTIRGTLNKSICLIGILLVTGLFSASFAAASPAFGQSLAIVSGLVGFGVAILTIFRPQSSPVTAPIYAVVEGLALGAITAMYASVSGGVVALAVPLTLAVALLMLGLYRAGILRATPMFTRMVVVATGAVVVVYVAYGVLALFGLRIPGIFTPTPLGIGISLVVVAIAALNLIVDFDFIERGAEQGAPAFMEWYSAFSLCVTLVWLYLELLRLLSLLSSRD